MTSNFYLYQQRVLNILLTWGVTNGVAGTLMLLTHSSFWRQFGLQALSWGAIDALLAVAGLRSARDKAQHYSVGELDNADALRDARTFQRVLLFNVGLDFLYIATGLEVARRFSHREDRRGMGLGIALQGLFLLVFDALAAGDVRQHWVSNEEIL